MNGLKAKDEYGNILTVLEVNDNIVKVYERPNDTIHASNLFVNGISLINFSYSEKLGKLVSISQD